MQQPTNTKKRKKKTAVKNDTADFKASILNTNSDWLFTGSNFDFGISDTALLNTYNTSIYVYRATKLIAETASNYPLKLQQITNTEGDTEEVLSSPAIDVLSSYTQAPAYTQLFQYIYTHRLLTGKAYLWIKSNDEIEVVQPNLVTMNVNKATNEITSYTIRKGYGSNGTGYGTFVVEPDDMIVFRDIDPLNVNNGTPATAAARFRITLENKISQFNNAILDNGGVPAKIISPKKPPQVSDKDQLAEAQRAFEQQFRGVQNQGKTLVAATPVDVKELSATVKDLQLQESLDFTAKEIEIAFGLPHGILQSENVNAADGKNSINNLVQFTIKPMVKSVLDVLNNKFVSRYGERLYYSVEFPTMEDEKSKAEELETLVSAGIITADEARLKLGYEPRGEDADELRMREQRPQAQAMIRTRSSLRDVLKRKEQNIRELKAKKIRAKAEKEADNILKQKK